MPNRRRTPSRRTARSAPRRNEPSAGFAIGVYDQRLIEDNALERFGQRWGDPADRDRAMSDGLVDAQGEITEKGWSLLGDDIDKLEHNSLAWLRSKFSHVRDEGHASNDDLVGSLQFDPRNLEQAAAIDLASPSPGESERIDMADASYGDLADTAFDGVSDFGGSLLGGSITFYDVTPPESWETIEETLDRWRKSMRRKRR